MLRLAISAVRTAEIDARHSLTDDEVLALLAREVRQRQDALEAIAGRDRQEAEERLRQEIEILRDYLPQPLGAEELAAVVRAAVAEAGATSMRDMGRVMALVLPRVRGRADGAAVQQAVRAQLGGA